MSFPRYPAYKDSGLEWLGEIPVDWTTGRVKDVFRVVSGATPRSDDPLLWDGDVVWVTPSDISGETPKRIRSSHRMISADGLASCAATQVPSGSIILSTRAPIGSLALADVELCTNQGCKCLIAHRKSLAKYFLYVLWASTSELNLRGRGTTFLELSADALSTFPLPIPSEDEQSVIADFLDRETAKIDALVAEQERLIGLLKEKRRTLISEAVARGFGNGSNFKDGGSPWLGQIPSGWKLMPFSAAIEFQEGPGILAGDFRDEGVPLLRVSGVQGRWATLDGCNFLDPTMVDARWKHFRLSPGDLIISASASMGTVSEVSEATAGAVPYTGLISLRPKVGITRDYIRWLCVSSIFLIQIELLKAGATIQHFGPTHLRRMRIPVPPLREQVEIASRLADATSSIDGLVLEAEHAIRLLKERRSALISAAVTGTIDVRGIAPDVQEAA